MEQHSDVETTNPRDQIQSDICLTCKHLPGCVHRSKQTTSILFCDLYEEGVWSADLVVAIIDKHSNERGGLISILEAIQAKYGFLPESALRVVAQRTGRSLVDIYGVATFYSAFTLEPRGRHLCSVCMGTACHVRNAPAVSEEFQRQLGIHPGETTGDREFSLETVNCLGACALGPIVVVDGHYFPQVNTRQVGEIIDKTQVGLDFVEVATDQRVFPVEVFCARCNRSLMDAGHPIDGHPSVRVTISFGRKHGWLRLSSLYGSYTIEAEDEIPEDTVAQFFCPTCHAELAGATDCPICAAPMVPLIIRGGGMVQICSRRGCTSHLLDVSGLGA
ncbi:MAG: NAD(P)H-dependent oxidoreductase subunit E [Thermoanaerobaculales bacterium]|nr:NAD(P)H-dependent oxidoreductase subunit E [Thermoanaerobaculales bacterium]